MDSTLAMDSGGMSRHVSLVDRMIDFHVSGLTHSEWGIPRALACFNVKCSIVSCRLPPVQTSLGRSPKFWGTQWGVLIGYNYKHFHMVTFGNMSPYRLQIAAR